MLSASLIGPPRRGVGIIESAIQKYEYKYTVTPENNRYKAPKTGTNIAPNLRRSTMKKHISLFIIFLLLGTTAAVHSLESKTTGNKTINAPASIRTVTVYPDRALVTREFHTTLEPGRYTLEFQSIPMNLLEKSLRVKARGTAAAKILDIKEKTITLKPPPDKVKQLETNIQAIDIQLKQLDDSKKILDKKEKYLEKLLQKTLDSISNTNPDSKSTKPFSPTDYKNMPDFMETHLNASLKKRWELDDKKRTLTEKKNQLQTELNRLNGEKGTRAKKVLVNVSVSQAGTLTAALSYLMSNASWAPVYDLRLSPSNEKDTLTYSARVIQETGEDWEDVKLTLSTARPPEYKDIPSLVPVYLDVRKPTGAIAGKVVTPDGEFLPGITITLDAPNVGERKTITDARGKYRFLDLPPGNYALTATLEGFNTVEWRDLRVIGGKTSIADITMHLSSLRETVVISGKSPAADVRYSQSAIDGEKLREALEIMSETAGISRGTLSTSFTIKHRDTIPSGPDPTKVMIAMDGVKVEKEYIAVPKHLNKTFLNAKVKNISGAPLLAGPVNLFLDGAFVHTGNIGYIVPKETFEMPVGLDPGIRVERTVMERESKLKKALFQKTKIEIPSGYTIRVKNLKERRVEVIVRDLLPVSKDEKIVVKVEAISPKASESKEDEPKKGFLSWKLALAPGEEKTITVKYTVIHPKDIEIQRY